MWEVSGATTGSEEAMAAVGVVMVEVVAPVVMEAVVEDVAKR